MFLGCPGGGGEEKILVNPETVARDSSGVGTGGQRGLWGLGIDSRSLMLQETQVTVAGDTGLALTNRTNRTKSHWREAYVALTSKG